MYSSGSTLDPVCTQSPLGQCHPIARMEKWGLAGSLPLQAAVWGWGAGFSFLRMPSSHFSYLRETWPRFPTVNICDVKPGENMFLSGFILAGFYELSAPQPVYLAGLQ